MSKISLKPADTGTATFTLEAPATNTNRTLTLPDEAGTLATVENLPSGEITSGDLPAGSVIQVVTTVSTVSSTTTSTSFVNTGLSASIVPKSTQNKILVQYTARHNADANESILSTVYRDGIGLHSDAGLVQVFVESERPFVTTGASFLDSPSSTSSLDYSVHFRSVTGLNVQFGRSSQEATITLMEIAG